MVKQGRKASTLSKTARKVSEMQDSGTGHAYGVQTCLEMNDKRRADAEHDMLQHMPAVLSPKQLAAANGAKVLEAQLHLSLYISVAYI